jgi:predicted GIY-YIG superfamily endonuclease
MGQVAGGFLSWFAQGFICQVRYIPVETALQSRIGEKAGWTRVTAGISWRNHMRRKDRRPGAKPSSKAWFVYLLRCADGTLYTGIAKDVSRRCQQHNAGTASRYTRSRLPVELVYQETHASRGSALRREAAIKALPRRQKESIILLAV